MASILFWKLMQWGGWALGGEEEAVVIPELPIERGERR